jgi:hypothetical protein
LLSADGVSSKMKTTVKYFRIDRREICFIHFIFEACDGLATVTTIDPALGIIKLSIAPGAEDDTDSIILGLKSDGIMIETAEFVISEPGNL